ncbi:MAG: TonB-dependent receptor [Bacteroidetes bacterium]|nr:TonB-dependent receptor [Bacteroidota bacterium]
MRLALLFCIVSLSAALATAQTSAITQIVRGTVIDRESNSPLIGVNVAVHIGDKLIGGTATDDKGYFRIENVPVGRVNISASYIGYNKVTLPNTPVTAAKEVVLRLEMEPAVTEINEVQVNAGKRRGESINDMAQTSARQFTVEEATRYAGSRSDPARMASNFAGVSGTDDSRNDIVVRGNSPLGVLWRVENVDIPNPSHFAIAGTTGGSVNVLNNKSLANSDFLTGAFPAEYGNALAAVFDVRFKNGNDEKHEASLQWGLLGLEASAEGPIDRKRKSSYQFAYRYSTLDLLVKMGVDIGTSAVPHYQDLNFKLNFPLRKGNISLFGIAGYSTIQFITSTDVRPGGQDIYASNNTDEWFRSGLGIFGISYTRPISARCYSKITFAASGTTIGDHYNRVVRHVDSATGNFIVDGMYRQMGYRFVESRFSGNFYRNYKLTNRHSLRFGMNSQMLTFNYTDSNLNEQRYQWEYRLQYKGVHFLFLPYVQWKYNISRKVSMTAGLHGQLFTLNWSWSLEPRASVKYQFKPNQSIALGTGLHSQTQPYYAYFQRENFTDRRDTRLRNNDLGFTRSFHVVGSYDVFFRQDVRIKVEGYFQYIYDLPVDTFASSYSILNEGTGFDRFFPGKLVNKGVGRNMGVELTVEKFFTHNWFAMFSGSLYDARYRASDGQWYNSDFNGHYVMNLLGTKEFKWGKKRLNTIGIGGKITFGGGRRYTPFDLARSAETGQPVVQDALRNKFEFKPYFRFDVKINYSFNSRKHLTQEVGVDLVNVTGQKNILRLQYINTSAQPQVIYQLGFLPLFYYRVDFGFARKK